MSKLLFHSVSNVSLFQVEDEALKQKMVNGMSPNGKAPQQKTSMKIQASHRGVREAEREYVSELWGGGKSMRS